MKNLKDTIHAYIFVFSVDDPLSFTIVREQIIIDDGVISVGHEERTFSSQTCRRESI